MPRKFVARIIKDGRITIPNELRELLHLDEGDLVEVNLKKVDK